MSDDGSGLIPNSFVVSNYVSTETSAFARLRGQAPCGNGPIFPGNASIPPRNTVEMVCIALHKIIHLRFLRLWINILALVRGLR